MTPKPDDRPALVDPRVGDAWREASSEEPSAAVDAAILAAARQEVSARPETLAAWEAREVRASRRRWWPLAAAATVAAIAVGVVQLTPSDKVASPATETATVSDVPSPAAKPDALAAASAPQPPAPPSATAPTSASASASGPSPTAPPVSKPAPPQSRKEKSARSDDVRPNAGAPKVEAQQRSGPAAASAEPSQREQPAAPAPSKQPAAPAFASTPDPFPAATKAPAENATAGAQAAASPPMSAQLAPPAAPAAPTPAPPLAKTAAAPAADSGAADARGKDRKPLPVADWIALIRRLRAESKTDEAARELAAFRAAHPDHEKLLPPDLRDWRPPDK